MTHDPDWTRQLEELARLHGVLLSFYEIDGRRVDAAPESLLGVLRALGAPVAREADVPGALREARIAPWRRPVEPVVVAWDGAAVELDLRLPEAEAGASFDARLAVDGGEARGGPGLFADAAPPEAAEIDGARFVRRRLRGPAGLPPGYHRLRIETGGRACETLVLAAPSRAFVRDDRTWGVFLPLYALRTRRDRGCGDLGDLRALMDWVYARGGGVVATLPLLAAFLDEPFEPSPYAPVSRLFWNELYLDLDALAASIGAPKSAAPAAPPPADGLVDYRAVAAARRRVLEALAARFVGTGGPRGAAGRDFARFVAETPRVDDYARFRAMGERTRKTWPLWPAPARDGVLRDGDLDPAAIRYHRFVQWAAESQLRALAGRARSRGAGLYLDLPLGVNRDGYDIWRERDVFTLEASAGAPPDGFFPGGQEWGFPPFHPGRLREQGYRHYIDCLRHHLRHAGMLRIDHVMGLHRLYWVPRGLDARRGAYVAGRLDELCAIVTIESHRHQAMIVGENLGTVPEEIWKAMPRHRLLDMYTVEYELGALKPPRVPAGDSVAGLNTHDLPPFAAFWSGADIDERERLGFHDATAAGAERSRRAAMRDVLVRFLREKGLLAADGEPDPAGVLVAVLAWLGASDARVVFASLEDLWGETLPQNIPGTGPPMPNWRRRARHALEAMGRLGSVRKAVAALAAARPVRKA
jgi:4-alpha-glucanotransferase